MATHKKILAFLAIGLFLPLSAWAAADLSISPAGITFSHPKPLAGDDIRIYATVHNAGQQDARASVRFMIDNVPLGGDQPMTVVVGKTTTVFVDWKPHEGYYTIGAEVINVDPADGTLADNRAEIKNFLVNKDTDNDGSPDTEDWDDDNDGVNDGVELVNGTNPLKADTDGDGVNDKEDAYPLDPTRSAKAVSAPPAAPAESPAPSAPAAPATTALPPSSQPKSEKPVALELTREQVTYTFPDIDQAAYRLDISLAKSRHDWRTWEFEALGGDKSFIYLWDFGDGKLSQSQNPAHRFPAWGTYKITLSASDNTGGLAKIEDTIQISFWNINNPYLQALLGLLGLVVMGLVLIAFRDVSPFLKKYLPYDL